MKTAREDYYQASLDLRDYCDEIIEKVDVLRNIIGELAKENKKLKKENKKLKKRGGVKNGNLGR